jgi:hypothetical protein
MEIFLEAAKQKLLTELALQNIITYHHKHLKGLHIISNSFKNWVSGFIENYFPYLKDVFHTAALCDLIFIISDNSTNLPLPTFFHVLQIDFVRKMFNNRAGLYKELYYIVSKERLPSFKHVDEFHEWTLKTHAIIVSHTTSLISRQEKTYEGEIRKLVCDTFNLKRESRGVQIT